MWIIRFQIAVLEKDVNRIDELLDQVPQFENKQDAEKAMYLIREGMELIYKLQDDLNASMRQMKKSIDFLGSGSNPYAGSRLNIKS